MKAFDFLRAVLKVTDRKNIQEMVEEFKEEFHWNVATRCGGVGEIEKKFFEKYRPRFNAMFEKANRKDLKGFFKDTKELLLEIDKALKDPKVLRCSTVLSEYSPSLASFNKSNFFETIELFDQYDGEIEPNPSSHVKIAAFGNKVSVFTSIRKPIKICIIGK